MSDEYLDRVGPVVLLGREHDPLGRVVDIEELARRRRILKLDGVLARVHVEQSSSANRPRLRPAQVDPALEVDGGTA